VINRQLAFPADGVLETCFTLIATGDGNCYSHFLCVMVVAHALFEVESALY